MASRQLLIFSALLFIVKSCTCSTVAGSSSSSVSASSSSSLSAQNPLVSNGHIGVPAFITPIPNEHPILSYNNFGSNAIGGGYYGNGYANSNRNYYPNQSPIIVDSNDDDRSLNNLIYLLLLLRGNGNGNGNGCGNNGNYGCGGGYGNGGCNGGQSCGCGGNNGYSSNYGGYGNNGGFSRNGYGYSSNSYSSGPAVEITSSAEETVLYPGNSYSYYCEPKEINLVIRNESCGKSS